MLPNVICLNIPQPSPYFFPTKTMNADSGGRAVYRIFLRPLICWRWGFASRRRL